MSIKKQIKRGTIQKVYQLHNGIFHPIQFLTLCQFYNVISPMLVTKLH